MHAETDKANADAHGGRQSPSIRMLESILILGLCGLPYSKSDEADSFNFGLVTTIQTTTLVYYAPNPGYDSYWVGGAWVFGPTRTPTTTRTNEKLRTVNSERVLVCGRPCARIYRKLIGKVCASKLDNVYDPRYDGAWQHARVAGLVDWRLGGVLDRNYDYLRTLGSYCEFLDLQCRTKIYHGIGYVFLHMGQCLRDEDAFPNLMAAQAVRDRKQLMVGRYGAQMDRWRDGKQNSPMRSYPSFYISLILYFALSHTTEMLR